ncbi:Protein kinase of the Mitotic Exit Network, variant 3 [Basidiobolus ranarum]
MMEIDLLKKLKHQNIVKYGGFIKTEDHLNIILEYCENGSLKTISKRFGKFPENLVAIYVTQVLEGLFYLHEQGVIHRDIKCANILSTKDGKIKLADFGVATIAHRKDSSVVGSPYWMAPEVIELSGATTASDIWSVGCTVVEMLEGDPPYYNLSPMPALFRIVQDEHPPLPEGASSGVKDFLMQCFQKDQNLRVSAKKLLKHPWVQGVLKRSVFSSQISSKFDEDVRSVQLWNAALKETYSSPRVNMNSSERRKKFAATYRSAEDDLNNDVFEGNPNISFKPNAERLFNLTFSPYPSPAPIKAKLASATIEPEENEDIWDDDFIVSDSDLTLSRMKNGGINIDIHEEHYVRVDRVETYIEECDDHSPTHDEDEIIVGKLQTIRLDDTESIGLVPPKDILQQRLQANLLDVDARKSRGISQYMETEEDDYSDLFGKAHIDVEASTFQTLQLNPEYGFKSMLTDECESDSDDPFANMDENFEEMDLEANMVKDKKARICNEITELIRELQSDKSEEEISEICSRMIGILIDHPEMKSKFISYHGIIPIMEILQASTKESIVGKLLQIINQIVYNNQEIQEYLCLVGGIPVVMDFASRKYHRNIRIEAAYFIKQMCHTSTLTLQMFISCRGLKVLVDFLEEGYNVEKELVWIGINGISSIFELNGPTPKNDFCHLFAKSGFLEPLANVLHHTSNDDDPLALKYLTKVVNIFVIFSQADNNIRELMATRHVLKRILNELSSLPPDLFLRMLKCVKNISMNSSTLETLQKVNVIPILTTCLDRSESIYSTETSNQILNVMFNLCHINKNRQEIAAGSGLIPHLQRFVEENSPMRQFALPILCQMAHAGRICRYALQRHNGLQLYISLLLDPYWQVNAMEAILVWVQDEPAAVEAVLLLPDNIRTLTKAFVYAKNSSFTNLLEPLQKLMRLSKPVNRGIAKPNFMGKLLEKLSHPKASVRLNLLRILRSVYDYSLNPKGLVNDYSLLPLVDKLSKEDPAVLVCEIAREMLLQFEEQMMGKIAI